MGDIIGRQEEHSRPDPNEYNVHDVQGAFPTEIVEHFYNCQENVWNIHGCVYCVSNEREVDPITPP